MNTRYRSNRLKGSRQSLWSRMKVLLTLLLIACCCGVILTFWLFAPQTAERDPVRSHYAPVFEKFGIHAEETYRQYEDAYGLEILQQADIEGLNILLQYAPFVHKLQPYFDVNALIAICQEFGPHLEPFLTQFQPDVLADIYEEFGRDGLKYLLDQPERYFLLKRYGDRLIQLANAKGPIVFDLVRTYQPEFLELYYDEALFKTIAYVGVDGLLALKTYQGMAATVLNLFAEDPRLVTAFRQYGYQPVIPVLHYFYQWRDPALMASHASEQAESATPAVPSVSPTLPDERTTASQQFDQANWALGQIIAQGHTFLRQFEIAATGDVTLRTIVPFVNLVERALFGDFRETSPRRPKINQEGQPAAAQAALACEQMIAALDLLGILTPETLLSREMRCTYLQSGIMAATSPEGGAGLMTLEEHQDVVDRFGPAVAPFVARYGTKGIDLLEITDGAILSSENLYGQDVVSAASLYGADVLPLVNQFGRPILDVILATQGKVIPAAQQYGEEVLHLLARPDGQALFLVSASFGEEAVKYTLQYPDEFPRYLLKYGALSVKALTKYNRSVLTTAHKSGDDVVWFAGQYEDLALRFINAGQIGLSLLRVLPTEVIEQNNRQILRQGWLSLYLKLLITSPRAMHTYIGAVSQDIFALAPYVLQLAFWTLLLWIILVVFWGIITTIRHLFIW